MAYNTGLSFGAASFQIQIQHPAIRMLANNRTLPSRLSIFPSIISSNFIRHDFALHLLLEFSIQLLRFSVARAY